MDLAAILDILWKRRVIVALGVIVAIASGLLLGRQSQVRGAAAESTVGSVRMVLDTSDSQLVEAAPEGADTLPIRAALLANAMAAKSATDVIARAAGVPADQLVVVGPAAKKTPTLETPLVSQVSQATLSADAPFVVDVSADELTPIISIEAHARNPSQVRRLTEAAGEGLRTLLAAEDGSHSRGFVLDTAAPVRIEQLTTSSSQMPMIIGGALATLVCWCIGIVLVVGLARRSRRPRFAAERG